MHSVMKRKPPQVTRMLTVMVFSKLFVFLKSVEFSVVISVFREFPVQIPPVLGTSSLKAHVRAIPGSTVF